MSKGCCLTVLCFVLLGNYGGYCQEKEQSKIVVADAQLIMFPSEASNVTSEKLCLYVVTEGTSQVPVRRFELENATGVNPCEDDWNGGLSLKRNDSLLVMNYTTSCNVSTYLSFTEEKGAPGLLLIRSTAIKVSNLSLGTLEVLGTLNPSTGNKLLSVMESGEAFGELHKIDKDSGFEWSTVCLWVIACFCVAVGSLTSPYYDPHKSSGRHQILSGTEGPSDPPPPQVVFTVTVVLFMVLCISTMLMLLYFFFSYLVYVLMGIFCIASGRAMYEILVQIVNLCFSDIDDKLPNIKGHGIHKLVLALISCSLPIIWIIFRHDPHIWILEDILGTCFCIFLIQSMKLPSLKICSFLLSMLFVYDIFFVFITPYITSDGKSVMVEVATGGGTGETLPLLFRLPHFGRSVPCSGLGYSLLGFGDIILPGFLVAYAHAFDLLQGDKRRPYFLTAMIFYGIGLFMAFVALYYTRIGQPALLYIVPSILIPLFIVARVRRQFKQIWEGSISLPEITA